MVKTKRLTRKKSLHQKTLKKKIQKKCSCL